ncbi:MAG: hypothetical protein K8R87_05345 [Verrucomicrobia bacterium]|nr:hypothetical protein [Verrucomicrobiota bacterium]
MKTHILWFIGVLTILGISPAALRAEDDIHVLYQEGRDAYNAGQFEIAREKLALVLLKNPEHPQTRAMMAQIELKIGADNTLMRKKFDKVILEKFEVDDVELGESIQALKIMAKNASGGKIMPNIIVSDSELGKKHVSLVLEKIPLSEALRYLAQLSGAHLSYDKNAVIFSKPGS